MDLKKIHFTPSFYLLFVFWVMWVYTEVAEYYARDAYKEKVDAFMARGDRFTGEQGAELEARIRQLEETLNDRHD